MNSDRQSTPQTIRLLRSLTLAIVLVALGAALGFCDQPRVKWQGTHSDRSMVKASWVSSWDEAIVQSTDSGKPVMLMFTGSDWCPWSERLEREILQTAEFAGWSDRVVLIQVDFPKQHTLPERTIRQNDVLKEWYGEFVNGFPTALFVMPDGHVIGTVEFVEGGPAAWIERANEVLLESSDLTAGFLRNVQGIRIAQSDAFDGSGHDWLAAIR